MRKKLIFTCFLLLCFCLSSCRHIDPITPVDYSNLLLKVKELFALCSVLVSSNDLTSNGQAISRIYYAFYHLARLLNINIHNMEQKSHTQAWKKISDQNIQQFGLDLKTLREKYDYDPIDPQTGGAMIKRDLAYIVSHEADVEALLNKIKSTLHQCIALSPQDIVNLRKDISDIEQEQKSLFNSLKAKP